MTQKTQQELSKFQKGERPFEKGGFGSVFLGLLETGELIAVKEIEYQSSDSEIEVLFLSVSFLFFCVCVFLILTLSQRLHNAGTFVFC